MKVAWRVNCNELELSWFLYSSLSFKYPHCNFNEYWFTSRRACWLTFCAKIHHLHHQLFPKYWKRVVDSQGEGHTKWTKCHHLYYCIQTMGWFYYWLHHQDAHKSWHLGAIQRGLELIRRPKFILTREFFKWNSRWTPFLRKICWT